MAYPVNHKDRNVNRNKRYRYHNRSSSTKRPNEYNNHYNDDTKYPINKRISRYDNSPKPLSEPGSPRPVSYEQNSIYKKSQYDTSKGIIRNKYSLTSTPLGSTSTPHQFNRNDMFNNNAKLRSISFNPNNTPINYSAGRISRYEMKSDNNKSSQSSTTISTDNSNDTISRYQPNIVLTKNAGSPASKDNDNSVLSVRKVPSNSTKATDNDKRPKSRYNPIQNPHQLESRKYAHISTKIRKLNSHQRMSRFQDYHKGHNRYDKDDSPHHRHQKPHSQHGYYHSYRRSTHSPFSMSQSYIKPQAKIHAQKANIYNQGNTVPIIKAKNTTINDSEYTPIISTENITENKTTSKDYIELLQPKITDEVIEETPVEEEDKITYIDNEHNISTNEIKSETSELILNYNFDEETKKVHSLHSEEYEYISDPKLLQTDINSLPHQNIYPFPKDCPTYSKCIFPLTKLESRLWELKFKHKNKLIHRPKYLLKKHIGSLTEYPTYLKTHIKHSQKFKLLSKLLIKFKQNEKHSILTFKQKFINDKQNWIKICKELERRTEALEDMLGVSIHRDESHRENEREKTFDSSHLSRGDYVDDDELDDIMCEIDAAYRHNKQAAIIPPMVSDPIKRNVIQFSNVSNLVTDKNKWASRLIIDEIDTFTPLEHDLFVKGYLRFPKKFGKISQFMKGLRTTEDCVLHYYKTKKNVNYKALIKERNMNRIKMRGKSNKRIVKEQETEEDSDTTYSMDNADLVIEDAIEQSDEDEMDEDEE